jgi:hypothetical protein
VPATSSDPVPVCVNFHGGGFILRHPELDDPLCGYPRLPRARAETSS